MLLPRIFTLANITFVHGGRTRTRARRRASTLNHYTTQQLQLTRNYSTAKPKPKVNPNYFPGAFMSNVTDPRERKKRVRRRKKKRNHSFMDIVLLYRFIQVVHSHTFPLFLYISLFFPAWKR